MGREIPCGGIFGPMVSLLRAFKGAASRFDAARIFLMVLVACLGTMMACSCTLLAHSPRLKKQITIPVLNRGRGLIVSPSGRVPYQRWRIPSWGNDLRYVWLVGYHDFRRSNRVELILYFHGMHSKDYFRSFRNELEELAIKRPSRPFIFAGFVDTPFAGSTSRSKNRWKLLAPHIGDRPDRLFRSINDIYSAFRRSFPHIRKSRTRLTLAGFSGGGRVLNSVGTWLAHCPRSDPYASVFRSRLSKMVYFDCWFDPSIVETVPTLLANSPRMKIVGTVHMKKPLKHAAVLAGKFKMKRRKRRDELIGAGGRLIIFRDKSHWRAMIDRLTEALGG
jgi:hypothetical protein